MNCATTKICFADWPNVKSIRIDLNLSVNVISGQSRRRGVAKDREGIPTKCGESKQKRVPRNMGIVFLVVATPHNARLAIMENKLCNKSCSINDAKSLKFAILH